MMSKIIEAIFVTLVLLFSIIFFIKGYRETKNDFEKILYILLSFSFIIPLIIYYLDRYNLPSKLGYMKNVNTSDWINILINYSAVIISTLINAVFLIFVTFKQINETYKDNIRLNNETQRLQNLPFLVYNFTYEKLSDNPFLKKEHWIFSKHKGQNLVPIDFTIEIKNIGLNSVRKIYLQLESKIFNNKEIVEFSSQSNIEKNEIKKKEFIISNVKKGTHKLEIMVYYQDLLKNWYKQKIYLDISVSNIYEPQNGGYARIESFIVEDEEKITTGPINKRNNKHTYYFKV